MKNKSFATRQLPFLQTTGGLILTAVFCNFLWGSAFPCVKTGYRLFQIHTSDSASQLLFAGVRFTLAGLMVLLIGSLSSRCFLKLSRRTLPKALSLSLFQTILQYLFFYIGLAHTTGVKASIIEATSVFMAILISGLFFGLERFTLSKTLGCLLGFAGVVLVNVAGSSLSFSFSLSGEGFIIISTVSYAFSTVLMKYYSVSENPILLSSWQFLLGGLIMTALGLLFGGRLHLTTPACIPLLLYMAFISAAAYSLWGLLLKYHPISKVAVFGFTNPIFGVTLSALFLRENGSAFGFSTLTALILVCLGIWLVNHSGTAVSPAPSDHGQTASASDASQDVRS